SVIEIAPELEQIPLFVKEGGIIPMIPPVLRTPRKDDMLPLTVRHYGHAENSIQLYDDDGETFDYEKGAYARALLSVKKDKKGVLKGSAALPKSKFFHYNKAEWVFMTK